MNENVDIIHPTHCFCQIPDEEMRPWVVKRYGEHKPTMQLLKSTDDSREKEIISIVAMLDVDEETMLDMMGNVELPQHHIIHCRQHVKEMLGIAESPGEQ